MIRSFCPLVALTVLQETVATTKSMPTGLEWMVWASVIVPAVLLGVIMYLGNKTTVGR